MITNLKVKLINYHKLLKRYECMIDKDQLNHVKMGGTQCLPRLPPTTDTTKIQKRIDQDLIYTYQGALDSSYEAIRPSQILVSAEMPCFEDVVATIDQE